MRLLLDTHVLLWWLASPEDLSPPTRERVAGADWVGVSAATVWELEIKKALGKLDAPDDLLDQLAVKGFTSLAITAEHATAAGRLPRHHDDPFDRMIIAQAMVEDLVVVTRDSRFASYSVATLPT